MGILKKEKLEELLVANWNEFLDNSKLFAFVIQTVQSNINALAIIPSNKLKPKGMSISISHCVWHQSGLILWIEFQIPLAPDKIAEGTIEINLSEDGTISHNQTIGNIYCQNKL